MARPRRGENQDHADDHQDGGGQIRDRHSLSQEWNSDPRAADAGEGADALPHAENQTLPRRIAAARQEGLQVRLHEREACDHGSQGEEQYRSFFHEELVLVGDCLRSPDRSRRESP